MGDPREPPTSPGGEPEEEDAGGVDRTVRAAVPDPHQGERTYDSETGAVNKPHRPVVLLTTERQEDLPFPSRAPFIPGPIEVEHLELELELPVAESEGRQTARATAAVVSRVQELEELLDVPGLAEPTRATILAEIARLREVV